MPLELEDLPEPETKPKKSRAKDAPALTTAQRLGSLVKSARDTMRKDKGLSGDADRLPQLTWILFLKFLDDLEAQREEEALLNDAPYVPLLNAPYRWRDWAGDPQTALRGDDLKAFIEQQDSVHRPDGTRGPGLLAALRGFVGDAERRRAVIGDIFKNTQNRMADGYLLRTVIEKVNEIHFHSHEEIHTLGALYETMLKEMRDAAGDAGEFYTPRPVVRFMVEMTAPQLGETVYDPAAGTGGFLCETFKYLMRHHETIEAFDTIQNHTLQGGEAKPLPFLLCQMNLLLHGMERPDIQFQNSLSKKLGDIGERDRVSVILTNPPFGGEEEPSIQSNFPSDRRTSETALLFLQLIMRKLHRTPRPGRAAIVVPNGTLFGDGVCARIKRDLLTEFNLHTIVRLPAGVFAPYTGISTNLLFFDAGSPTTEIWYYEQPLPEGRKGYTKTQPVQFEEFAALSEWWQARTENEQAWRVPVSDVLKTDENGAVVSVNLDVKNPNRADDFIHLPPEALVRDILAKEREIACLMAEIEHTLKGGLL